jgi:hypothetical protein
MYEASHYIIFSVLLLTSFGVNLERRMLHKILYAVGKVEIPNNYCGQFYHPFLSSSSFLPLL